MRRRTFFYLIMGFCALVMVVGMVSWVYQQSPSREVYAAALAAYDKGDLPRAAALIKGKERTLLSYDEGCALMVSTYARLENVYELEDISWACIEAKKNLDVAVDGYAKSLTHQGKAAVALERMRAVLPQPLSERQKKALSILEQFPLKSE